MANYCNKICSVPYGPQYMIQYPCDTKPPECWDNKVLDWLFGYERTNGTTGTATPSRRSMTVPKPGDETGADNSGQSKRIIIFLAIVAALYFISKKI